MAFDAPKPAMNSDDVPNMYDTQGANLDELELDGGGLATEADRRRSSRQSFQANGWLSSEAGVGGRNHRINVSNLSLNGVGFSTQAPLEAEAVHWLVVDSGPFRASSRVRIVSCRESDCGHYDCGAEFF